MRLKDILSNFVKKAMKEVMINLKNLLMQVLIRCYYVQHYGVAIDIKSLFLTVSSVMSSKGVIEGGIGEKKDIRKRLFRVI